MVRQGRTKFTGSNGDQTHRFNKRVILETVRIHGPLSRADVSRRTSLSAQTVSNIVADLIGADLLRDERRRNGQRGQPPLDLVINPDGAFAFGISFDPRRLVAVLSDLSGAKRGSLELPVRETAPERVLVLIEQAVTRLLAEHPVPRDRISGIGLAMTGLTQHGTFIGLAPDPIVNSWKNFPAVERLQAMLGLPVYTDNDARAAAVGETLHGAGRLFHDFLYIYFGVGIGGGLVIAGQPFRGAFGRAGEIGHTIVDPHGIRCSCGNRGCLERYLSLSSAHAAVIGEPEVGLRADPDLVAAAFQRREPGMMRWIDVAAGHLKTTLVNLENTFDPETVVLGGVMPEPVLDAILAGMGDLPSSVSSRHRTDIPRLVRAAVGLDTPALGAASLAIFDKTAADTSLLFKTLGSDARASSALSTPSQTAASPDPSYLTAPSASPRTM